MAESTCLIGGCDRPTHARGLCGKHYQRWRDYGDPVRVKPTDEDRFWAKVDRSAGDDACWLWTGYRNAFGYGQHYYRNRLAGAHRFALELRLGRTLGPDEVARHQCHNPPCVNPGHLLPGEHIDNVHDMVRAGRARMLGARGEDNGKALLTEADVRDIRSSRQPRSALAAKYGVTVSAIKAVRARQNWRHVE